VRFSEVQIPVAQFDLGRLYRDHARISLDELWFRYFALTGTRTPPELEGILQRELRPSTHEHNVIAVALNEYFVEAEMDHFAPYIERWT
jgi:hypothetical protein